MSRVVSKVKTVFVFLIFFILFHLAFGSRIASAVVQYPIAAKLTEINRLTVLENNSVYINSADSSFISGSDSVSNNNAQSGVTTTDPRVLAMREFLIDHYSPLYTYSDVFVKEADKAGLDWRLVVSISGVESAFGNLIPGHSNNGWGWRGGPGGAYSNFASWKDGIATVTSRLAAGYGTNLTPFQIEPTYCPPCGQNPQHAWANGVTRFMNELLYYVQNLDSIY